MSHCIFVQRFFWSSVYSVYYASLTLLGFLINFLKNPFADPWAVKLRLEPPACLTDPKYGMHKYLIFNNTKLHYVESGDPSKPLMLFLHGFPEFWYSWRHQIVEFNKDYWCIALDMRGYGDSEKPDGLSPYKLNVLVDDVRDVVRQLGREKCILVAHDWGSLIGIKFRDTYPEAVQALIVLGGTSLQTWLEEVWSSSEQMKMSWYIFFFHCPWIPEKLIKMDDLAFFDKIMLVEGKDTITHQDVECYKYWFGKPTALTPPINYYRANFSYTVTKKPRCELPIPFIIINSEGDKFLSTNLLNRMKEDYANIETLLIDNCGHFIQQEEPQRLNSLIRDFLNKHNIK